MKKANKKSSMKTVVRVLRVRSGLKAGKTVRKAHAAKKAATA